MHTTQNKKAYYADNRDYFKDKQNAYYTATRDKKKRVVRHTTQQTQTTSRHTAHLRNCFVIQTTVVDLYVFVYFFGF
jgi:hypothetical protein